jgi:hypothetical protein
MKGMPGLYYSQGGGEPRPPRWIGSILYVDADTAEVRRLYDREDAAPLPPQAMRVAPESSWRPSLSSFIRRIAGIAGAST